MEQRGARNRGGKRSRGANAYEQPVPKEEDGKYGRRQIRSNWSRYESDATDVGGEEKPDFADLLNQSSDCSYFRFKSEKNWDSEIANSSLISNNLFDLDVNLLSAGLSCIPYYELIDLDKNLLSESDIEKFDKRARDGESQYKTVLDGFLKKLEKDYELTDLVECNANAEKCQSHDVQQDICEKMTKCLMEDNSKSRKDMSKSENLEDWLDSVLDE